MKNLLTKELFISLLSSVVIPSGIQAGFFVVIEDEFKVTSGTLIGMIVAAGVAEVLKVPEVEEKVAVVMAVGAGVGAAVGTAVETARVEVAVGSAVGSAVGTVVGTVTGFAAGSLARKVLEGQVGEGKVVEIVSTFVVAGVLGGGAVIGAVKGKRITEKLFPRKNCSR